jgi:hypothetical protein
MLKNLTYKKRLICLMIAGLLILLLAYQVAIFPTLKLRRDLNSLQSKLAQVEKAPGIIAGYETRLAEINAKIGGNYSQNPDFQKNLLNEISSNCERYSLMLRDFPQVHVWQKQNYDFITGYARIEGSYISLLKLLYKLESGHFYGRLVSVDFLSTEDLRAKKLRLTMAIYIQTIKQSENAGTEKKD